MKSSLSIFTASVLTLLLASCATDKSSPVSATEERPVQVDVVQVAAEPLSLTVPVTGTLVSTSEVDVKAETIGRIVRFDKTEGDAVNAGETVVWLDEENYRLALKQAESAVQVTEAGLEKARVMQAHSQSELKRAQNLLRSGGITQMDLEAAEVAEQDALAQVSLAEAQLAQARASVEVTGKRLRDCQIRARISGVIQRKFVNPGAYVEAPTMLFKIVDNQMLELESQVASADLAPIRKGQQVMFSVNSYPDRTFQARVLDVSPAMDTQTRSAKVRAKVDNSSGVLKTGMFVQGEIVTGVTAQALLIPASAVYRTDQSAKSSFVYVVESNRAVRREVTIGNESGQRLEITKGLQPGDLLIAEQSIQLADGALVEPRS